MNTSIQDEIRRCSREIAQIEVALLAGHPDVAGLCLALSDWSAEIRILNAELAGRQDAAENKKSRRPEGRRLGMPGPLFPERELEELVATIEGFLLPNGFEVKNNTRVYDDNGVQVAEFDVEIRGKLGSASIAWLIECRNRPGERPAPGAWIEQLVGRRQRFNFNKVTAVSTTGFSEGAIAYAKGADIDLRELAEVAPEAVEWLGVRSVRSTERRHWLQNAELIISENESPERLEAAAQALVGRGLNAPQLRSTQTGETTSLTTAFMYVVNEHPERLEGIVPNEPGRTVNLRIAYPEDDSHYVIDTSLGPVRIIRIEYDGTISLVEKLVPLTQVAEYRGVGEQPVTQTAAFASEELSLELHRVHDTGAIYITAKRHEPTEPEFSAVSITTQTRR